MQRWVSYAGEFSILSPSLLTTFSSLSATSATTRFTTGTHFMEIGNLIVVRVRVFLQLGVFDLLTWQLASRFQIVFRM